MTNSVIAGLRPEFNFSRDSGVALWDAAYSTTIWAIKFLGHVIKVNNGDFLDVSHISYWVLKCYLVKCYVFVGFLFPKFNIFFFFNHCFCTTKSEQLNSLFSVTSVEHNVFLIHLPWGSMGRKIILAYITGRICGFANGLLKKLNAKCFDSFHFSVLNIKANRINLLKIKILS